MKQLTRKFKSRRGASITIALLLFMLCGLAGATAFMMAASNAGRYSHSEEQDYYSISSAALLIVDLLDGLKYTSGAVTFTYEHKWDYTKNGENGHHATTDTYTLNIPESSEADTLNVNRLSGCRESFLNGKDGKKIGVCATIQAQCDKLIPFLNVPNEWYARDKKSPARPEKVDSVTYKFTIDVNNTDGTADSRYSTVNCQLVMNDNYDLIFTFDSGNGAYSVTVYWVADVTASVKSGEPVYVYAVPDASGNYVSGSMTILRTMNVTVKYEKENVTISRGDASGNNTSGAEEGA